jgi:hypothetical protein
MIWVLDDPILPSEWLLGLVGLIFIGKTDQAAVIDGSFLAGLHGGDNPEATGCQADQPLRDRDIGSAITGDEDR